MCDINKKNNDNLYTNFQNKCYQLEKSLFDNNNNIDFEQMHISRYKFIMKNSKDISFNLLRDAEINLDRNSALLKINNYINNIVISQNIERGLFEFTLLHITIKSLRYDIVPFVFYIYHSKLHTICSNLDIQDPNIENGTMLNAILNGELKAYLVAFLSPQQMHPDRWKLYNQKKLLEDDAMYNIETTNEYECPSCKERKCTVDYIQLRSADEPANKFIVCIVCGYTIIL